MGSKILAAIGPSSVSDKVLAFADQWATDVNGELFILHVEEPYPYLPDPKKPFQTFMEKQEIRSRHTVLTPFGSAGPVIIEQANAIKPDLIVMADHSRNVLTRLFLGGTANYVLHYSRYPIYIVKQSSEDWEDVILVPTDLSEVSMKVLKVADQLAGDHSELCVVHVNTRVGVYSDWGALAYGDNHLIQDKIMEEEEALHKKLNKVLQTLNLKSACRCLIRTGSPHQEVLGVQQELRAKSIVMAAHSYTLAKRMLLGSTSNYLLNHAKCPMYVYKE